MSIAISAAAQRVTTPRISAIPPRNSTSVRITAETAGTGIPIPRQHASDSVKSEYEQFLRAVDKKNNPDNYTQNREPPLLIGTVCHEISFLFGQLLRFSPPDEQQMPSMKVRAQKSGDLFSCHFQQLDH